MESPTVVVYRFEDSRGKGLYSAGGSRGLDHLHDPVMCPGPSHDKRLCEEATQKNLRQGDYGYYDSSLFGFSSKKQLRRWMQDQETIDMILSRDIKLKVFKVPRHKVALGSTQAVFDRTEAQYLKSITGFKI